jgi:hypothetical protein
MTLGRFIHTGRRAAWLGFVVLCLALLALGCKGTRTVMLDAEESTINATIPDTSEKGLLPPVPPAPITRPDEVIVYDTTSRHAVNLSFLEVDRTSQDETVTVRTQRDSQAVERTYDLPSFGEALRLDADSQGLRGSVAGSPEERQEEATAVEVPWWKQTERQIRFLLAFLGGVAFGIFGTKVFG